MGANIKSQSSFVVKGSRGGISYTRIPLSRVTTIRLFAAMMHCARWDGQKPLTAVYASERHSPFPLRYFISLSRSRIYA